MITKKLLTSSAFAALVLVGCGGGGSSSATTGYFVDAAVANADYDCVADGSVNKTTGADGSFTCSSMSHVRFRVGHLILGEIHTLPSDKYVFPHDLVGVARTENNNNVVAMAQLLQSLDSDGNPSNGITIAQETKILVEADTNFNPADVGVYLETASINPEHIPTHAAALQHLTQNVQAVAAANGGVAVGNAAANGGITTGNCTSIATGNCAGNAGVDAGNDAGNDAVDDSVDDTVDDTVDDANTGTGTGTGTA